MTSDATQDGPPARSFGTDLAARVRPRVARRPRHDSRRLVGAVGRSAVGFGLAIGRSSSIRPVVDAASLDTPTLRPPIGWWRDGAGDDGAVSDVAATVQRAPSWTERLVATAHPSRPTRQAQRPTAATRRASSEPFGIADDGFPAAPAGFVSTGNPRLDLLRRMVSAGMTPNDVARTATRSDEGAPTAPPDRAPTSRDDPGRVTARGSSADTSADRGATPAGRDTAPGSLGRRVRPEPVVPGERPVQAGTSTDRDRGASRAAPPTTPGPTRTGRDDAAATTDRTRRSSRPSRSSVAEQHAKPAAAANPYEALRRLLEANGALPPSGDREPDPAGPAVSPASRDGRGDIRRSHASDGPATARGRTAPGDARPATPATQRSTGPTDAAATGGDGRAADAGRDGRTDAGRAELFGGAEDAVPTAPSRDVARSLRVQRMITADAPTRTIVADRDPVDSEPGAATAPASSEPRTAGAVTLAAVGTIVAPTPRRLTRRRPSLPSAPSLAGEPAVLRRVTLPRALSNEHRPEPAHPAPASARTARGGRTGTAKRDPASIDPDSVDPVRVDPAGVDPGSSIHPVRVDPVMASIAPARGPAPARPPVATRPGHARRGWSLVPTGPGSLQRAVDATAPANAPSRAEPPAAPGPARPGLRAPTPDRGTATTEATAAGPSARRDAQVDPAPARLAVVPATAEPAPPTRGAGDDLAARFMTELSRSVRSRPAPLPTPFRPMADQIAARRSVVLSTDTASRRALRRVGKTAATTGDTIHLDPAATTAGRLGEVIAHELTHVAHPSPTPRFFDDDVDSPEERRAEATAKVMARSPIAPGASVLTRPGAPVRRSTDEIRRSPAATSARSLAPSTASSAPGTIDAASMAAAIVAGRSSSSAAGPASTIRRTAHTGGDGQTSHRPDHGTIRRELTTAAPGETSTDEAPTGSSSSDPSIGSPGAQEWFRTELERNIDLIIRRISEQVVIDLERRGGRMWGRI